MDLISKLQSAYEKFRQSKRILLIAHVSPDADALSSLGAMIELARAQGSEVQAFAERKPTGSYDFIPHEDEVSGTAPDDLRDFDLIMILDCGSVARTAVEDRLRLLVQAAKDGKIEKRPYIIEFDHHQPTDSIADIEIREADKASTTEIIYQFLKVNGLEINRVLADCILIGLMTDTGHFLHANSSQEALAVASEMLLRGASLPRIINKTIHNKSFAMLKVWGRALENMKFDPESGLASSALREHEINELLTPEERAAQTELFGDIVSFISCLSGVRLALLLREEDGRVKGSLRTNLDDVDVAQIAALWGGGGHKKAAGFSITGRLAETDKGWKIVK